METLDQWIAKLAEEQPIIIVEGPKDKAALKKLGLTEIIVLEGQPLYKIVDYVSKIKDECIILTDLDSEGKKLYSVLKRELQKNGVKIDNKFRHFLFKETQLRQIEGLFTYAQKELENHNRFKPAKN